MDPKLSRNEPISKNESSLVRVVDIETIANSRSDAYYAQKNYTAPANYKDIEKITAYTNKLRITDSKKAGLSWWTGQICSIVCGPEAFTGIDEKKLLIDFFTYLEKASLAHSPYHLVGKSYLDFDKPFIIGRAMVHDIGLPQQFRPNAYIEDIDHIFSRYGRSGQVSSLNNYAWGLGIGEKSGSGSEVQGWYDEGNLKKIESYCRDDVKLTQMIFDRGMKVFSIPEDNPMPF